MLNPNVGLKVHDYQLAMATTYCFFMLPNVKDLVLVPALQSIKKTYNCFGVLLKREKKIQILRGPKAQPRPDQRAVCGDQTGGGGARWPVTL